LAAADSFIVEEDSQSYFNSFIERVDLFKNGGLFFPVLIGIAALSSGLMWYYN
jgi:hypothetical protein